MAVNESMVLRIRGDVRDAVRQIQKVSDRVDRLGTRANKTSGTIKKLAGSFLAFKAAGAAIRGVFSGLDIAGPSIFKTTADFDDSIRLLSTRVEGLDFGKNSKSMEIFTGHVMNLAQTSRFTASEVAKAASSIGQVSDLKAGDIADVLPAVLSLGAAAGNEEDGLSLDGIAKLLQRTAGTFGKEVSDMSKMSDQFTFAINNSSASLEAIGNSLSYAATTAKVTGDEVEDVLAVFMGLADNFKEGSQAGTSVNRILATISSNAKGIKDDFGVDVTGMGVIDAMEALGKATENDAMKIRKLRDTFSLFGLSSSASIIEVIKDIKRYRSVLLSDDIKGLAEKNADALEGGLGGAIRRLRSAWEAMKITIGQTFAGELGGAMRTASAWLNENQEAVEKFMSGVKASAFAIKETIKFLATPNEDGTLGITRVFAFFIDSLSHMLDKFLIKLSGEFGKASFTMAGAIEKILPAALGGRHADTIDADVRANRGKIDIGVQRKLEERQAKFDSDHAALRGDARAKILDPAFAWLKEMFAKIEEKYKQRRKDSIDQLLRTPQRTPEQKAAAAAAAAAAKEEAMRRAANKAAQTAQMMSILKTMGPGVSSKFGGGGQQRGSAAAYKEILRMFGADKKQRHEQRMEFLLKRIAENTGKSESEIKSEVLG